MRHKHSRVQGFTIVELLIVIVVIGILAAIVIVAFNGVQQRARTASAQSDLSAIGKLVGMQHADRGTYSLGSAAYKKIIDDSKVTLNGLSFAICASADGYSIVDYRCTASVKQGAKMYYVSNAGGVTYFEHDAATTGSTALEKMCRQSYPGYTGMWWYGNI